MATTAGPLVVDVKPRHRAAKPEHAFTFAWTREAVESRGWHYEVWSEPPEAGHRLSGCSTRSSSTKYATGSWTGTRWERRSTACPVVRLRWSGPGSCTCSGSSNG